ncbi:MAG: SCO family protein [Polyangiaceae bacterium]|nr:SCO family protein [Polyangiaceae bacterium]
MRGPSLSAALIALALLVVPSFARADGSAQLSVDQVGIDQRLGNRLPLDASLRTTGGDTVTLRSVFRERPVVLILAYSKCPTLCNLVLREMVQATHGTEARPGRDYDLATISIDPDETLEIAKGTEDRLMSSAGLPASSGAWRYFLAEREAIDKVASAIGFRFAFDPQTRSWAHPAAAFVLTADGRLSSVLLGLRHDPAEIDAAVREAAQGRIAEPPKFSAATICFALEPSGKHAGAVRWGLRGLGIAVLGGLAALVLGVRGWRRTP